MENTVATTLDSSKLKSKIMANQRLLRFSDIFYRLSITSLILILLCISSTIITPVIWLTAVAALLIVIFFLVVFTFGLIFTMPNNPVPYLWDLLGKIFGIGENMNILLEFCFKAIDWIVYFGIGFSFVAIIFNSIAKRNGKVGRIVGLSIFALIFVAILAFNLITGGFKV